MDQAHLSVNQREADQNHHCDGPRRDRDCHRLRQGSRSPPETLRIWQDLPSVHIEKAAISLVIELGCGTGRFSELLAAHFGVEIIGIDPLKKMLDPARRKPAAGNVVYRQAAAEALPLPDDCADLVLMSMVYHHLTDPAAVARECHLVLPRGGYVCVRNGTRESDFPHRHFFPALRALIASDLPSRRAIRWAALRLSCIGS
jgi:SAM-dependent methyltransferase